MSTYKSFNVIKYKSFGHFNILILISFNSSSDKESNSISKDASNIIINIKSFITVSCNKTSYICNTLDHYKHRILQILQINIDPYPFFICYKQFRSY